MGDEALQSCGAETFGKGRYIYVWKRGRVIGDDGVVVEYGERIIGPYPGGSHAQDTDIVVDGAVDVQAGETEEVFETGRIGEVALRGEDGEGMPDLVEVVGGEVAVEIVKFV